MLARVARFAASKSVKRAPKAQKPLVKKRMYSTVRFDFSCSINSFSPEMHQYDKKITNTIYFTLIYSALR